MVLLTDPYGQAVCDPCFHQACPLPCSSALLITANTHCVQHLGPCAVFLRVAGCRYPTYEPHVDRMLMATYRGRCCDCCSNEGLPVLATHVSITHAHHVAHAPYEFHAQGKEEIDRGRKEGTHAACSRSRSQAQWVMLCQYILHCYTERPGKEEERSYRSDVEFTTAATTMQTHADASWVPWSTAMRR